MGRYSAARDLDLSIKDRWYLVANRVDAVIYRDRPKGRRFQFVERFTNPSSKLMEADLDSDRAGSGMSSNRGGVIRHALDRRFTRHEKTAATFAKKVAETINLASSEQRFHDLVVVAEPHFLGLLRSSFSAPVRRKIYRDIPREFAQGSDLKLQSFILRWLEK
ncbi:MAG: host attachment protein [Bdellovibrionota bacterium]